MSIFQYRNPISPIQVLSPVSVARNEVFGTNFSILGVGGFMEVYSLDDLQFTIPVGQTGNVEFTGNTIPIQFKKGTGSVFSPDVLTLNSDNISSGRRRLGMLVYVYETDKIYQFTIRNYDSLWSAATAATGTGGKSVVVSSFGTTVKNNTVAGQNLINAWTGSTIEGVSGFTNGNASWRILQTGGASVSGDYLPLSGGTVSGNTIFLSGVTSNTISATTYFNLPFTADTFVTGFSLNNNIITLSQNRDDQYSGFSISLSAYTGGTSVSGGFLPLSGGTVTGNTIFQSGFTANTLNLISLTGSTDRFVQTSSGGTLSASIDIISAYIVSGSTTANLLSNVSNWDINGNYTGSTISNTFAGQRYYDGNYFYEAVADNLFIRLIRG
jgi:hypothetical protein